ncbi:hypothetical protein SDC9_189157 [bioreactor metagenome]|uniref:Uncharacterized protein n=1 Tax=bioreactor metagenome TaxID=1076179 RepID=A0A645I283_9ZZZZ
MEIITQTGEDASLTDSFQRDQRPMSDQFVAVVEFDFPDPLMGGKRRFQFLLIQDVLRFDVRHFRLWQRHPEIVFGT